MKNSIIFYFAISVALLFIACNEEKIKSDDKEVNAAGFVKTNGSQILDEKGDPIILKGTNLGNWLVPEGYMFKMGEVNSPRKIDELLHELIGPDSLEAFWNGFLDNYITHEDIKYLKRIGCNHIRLPFHYKLFTDELFMGKRNAGFIYFDRLIEWCKKENLYVLFDMHCAPGGQTGDNIDDSYGYPYLFRSAASQDLMTDVWVQIARRYKDESIVLGYDIVNEPIASHFEDEINELNHTLFLLYKRITSEIRTVDKDHMIFLNGSVWSGNFDVFEEIIDDNTVYEFHKYWFDVNQDAIQPYLDFRERHQVPVYMGESGENTDQWVEEFRTLLDEHSVSWCFWPYKKMNNTRGIMNFDEPENYSLISDYAQSDRSTYKMVRKNRPDNLKVQGALNAFVEYALYKSNFPNQGYVKALGFKEN